MDGFASKYEALPYSTEASRHAVNVTECNGNPVHIAWVDGWPLTRECLGQALSNLQERFIVTPFDSVSNCIKYSDQTLDMIVYYSHDPDMVNVDDIISLRAAYPSVRIVVICDAIRLSPEIIKSVITEGASGLILASQTTLTMIVSSLGLVVSGGSCIARDFLVGDWQPEQQMSRQPTERSQLTKREVEVLALIKQGKPDKLIADALNLSVSTAKVHVRNILRKVGATNRTQAAMNADGYLGGV
jgi:DNA-binding NarL/FixJ family response regulator